MFLAVTGEIRTTAIIDFEATPQITFTVVATDNGMNRLSSSLPYTLTIVDANDNPPIFDVNPYTATIPENSPLGTFVLELSATDSDTGTNAQVTYSLVGGNDVFQIDTITGIVTVRNSASLDREGSSPLFFVQAIAQDMGTPPLSSQTLVNVKMTVYALTQIKDI